MKSVKLKVLCISRYFKGSEFLKAVHDAGEECYLLTSTKIKDEPWPYEFITDAFYMDEDENGEWNMNHVIEGLAYKMRELKFDIFVSLDDFDVENASFLREHFRIPGIGQTTARYFRDKLAMRMKAQEHGINIPAFTALFHDEDINKYVNHVPPPWFIKPRGQASATGIKKLYSAEELWNTLKELGNNRHKFLLEKFAPGDVYHVDSLSFDGKVIFTKVSKYLNTPFDVAHGGGIFRSITLGDREKDAVEIKKMNEKILNSFGMKYSASHTEYIKCNDDEKFYFLETSARVGGAHLSDMVEAASGINLWAEWAKIEIASKRKTTYKLPKKSKDYAGIIVSLSKFLNPDDSIFDAPEICWRLRKNYHIGLIVKSSSQARIKQLLDLYAEKIKNEFHASLPAPDRPTS